MTPIRCQFRGVPKRGIRFDEAAVANEAIEQMKLGVAVDSAYIRGAREQFERDRKEIERLREALEYFRDAQCDCSVAERDSGHLIGCWKPEADEKIRTALGVE